MYKISFVILHYMSYDFTKECIESILGNIKYSNYNIILVDNNSTNDSFNRLKEKFGNINNIYFIKNDDNLGFAKGNNVGYKFAKYELKSDFIILLNNDTIIEQENFVDLIIKKYEENKFYVLGPDIINLDNVHQNPQRLSLLNKNELIKNIIKLKIKLLFNYLGVEEFIINIYKKLKKVIKYNYNKNINNIMYEEVTNVQLHGACLIFSPLYISRFNGLYDKTFMFMEEDILFYTMLKENNLVLYSPDIKVVHKEDGATNLIYKKNSKKRMFIYKNVIKSSIIYLDYIENYELRKYNFMNKD